MSNPDVFLDSAIEHEEDRRRNHPSKPFRVPRYTVFCPRCHRGISNSKFLTRPFWMDEGPEVCGTCILDIQRQDITEERRREFMEHYT